LANGKVLRIEKSDGGLVINLPDTVHDKIASVIKLEVKRTVSNKNIVTNAK